MKVPAKIKTPKKGVDLVPASRFLWERAGIKGAVDDGSFAAARKHFHLLRERKGKRRTREVGDKLMGFPFQQQLLEGAGTGIPGSGSFGSDFCCYHISGVLRKETTKAEGWRPKVAPEGFTLKLQPGIKAETKPRSGEFLHFQSKASGSALVAFFGPD